MRTACTVVLVAVALAGCGTVAEHRAPEPSQAPRQVVVTVEGEADDIIKLSELPVNQAVIVGYGSGSGGAWDGVDAEGKLVTGGILPMHDTSSGWSVGRSDDRTLHVSARLETDGSKSEASATLMIEVGRQVFLRLPNDEHPTFVVVFRIE